MEITNCAERSSETIATATLTGEFEGSTLPSILKTIAIVYPDPFICYFNFICYRRFIFLVGLQGYRRPLASTQNNISLHIKQQGQSLRLCNKAGK